MENIYEKISLAADRKKVADVKDAGGWINRLISKTKAENPLAKTDAVAKKLYTDVPGKKYVSPHKGISLGVKAPKSDIEKLVKANYKPAAAAGGAGAKLKAAATAVKAAAAAHPVAVAGGVHALTAGLIAKKALEKPEVKIKRLERQAQKHEKKFGRAKLHASRGNIKARIDVEKIKRKVSDIKDKIKYQSHFLDHYSPEQLELRNYISETFNIEERRSRPSKGVAIGAALGNVPGALIGYGIGRAAESPADKAARRTLKRSLARNKASAKASLQSIKQEKSI